jgi:hypothetical protein
MDEHDQWRADLLGRFDVIQATLMLLVMESGDPAHLKSLVRSLLQIREDQALFAPASDVESGIVQAARERTFAAIFREPEQPSRGSPERKS